MDERPTGVVVAAEAAYDNSAASTIRPTPRAIHDVFMKGLSIKRQQVVPKAQPTFQHGFLASDYSGNDGRSRVTSL
jgi:heat shock protein HslJ